MTLYRSSTNPNLPLKQRHQVVVKVEILLANHNTKKQIHLILRKLLKTTARVLFIRVIYLTRTQASEGRRRLRPQTSQLFARPGCPRPFMVPEDDNRPLL